MNNIVTEERLAKYFDYTRRGIAEASKAINKKDEKNAVDFLDMSETHIVSEHAQEPPASTKECSCRYCLAHVFLDMASRYYSDAQFFEKKGDLVTAIAALSYAHGWLDAGARAGFFQVTNNELFTVD